MMRGRKTPTFSLLPERNPLYAFWALGRVLGIRTQPGFSLRPKLMRGTQTAGPPNKFQVGYVGTDHSKTALFFPLSLK